ncbi:MAG TPA: hypothetical protein VF134_02910 [Candidatus Dormibacteraeota bacterium]
MEPATVTATGWSGRHAVELYVRTYSTMLQSSGEIRLDSLDHVHIGMGSALHPLAAEARIDMGALIYSVRRLPAVITRCRRIVLGQSNHGFRAVLGTDISTWQQVKAPARRRRWYYDGEETLAVLIASPSDIDDLVPTLVAYQIEWNKLYRALQHGELHSEAARAAAQASEDDWLRLRAAWSPHFEERLAEVRAGECHMTLRMIGGSHIGYARAAGRWWQPIQDQLDQMGLAEAPLYFVSSNVHSLVNVLSGTARRFEGQVMEWVQEQHPELWEEWQKLEAGRSPASRDNWLYYATRVLFDRHPDRQRLREERRRLERANGIGHVISEGAGIDSGAQIFKLAELDPTCFDPRVGDVDPLRLKASDAAVINVDYPLGLAAYHVLRQVAEKAAWVRGVYVLGKAATLNADVGDVMIPNVVFDEHSNNTYWLDNCFTAADVQPHLVFGSALDNQRAVTVRGTFLQNREYLEFYYQGRYTIVEMEAGPYLDAAFEIREPGRYPMNENVNMSRVGYDLGIIHYASDTPYTQARTLGARGLDYRGMDSTYASAVAVARRILLQEGALLD